MKVNMQKDNNEIINILKDLICKDGIPVILEGDLFKASVLKKPDFQRQIGALEANGDISSVKRGKLTWYFLTELINIYKVEKKCN
jgi:hypothetical protein